MRRMLLPTSATAPAMLFSSSKRLQVLLEVAFLCYREAQAERAIVVVHYSRQRCCAAIMKIRRVRPRATQRCRAIALSCRSVRIIRIHIGLVRGMCDSTVDVGER